MACFSESDICESYLLCCLRTFLLFFQELGESKLLILPENGSADLSAADPLSSCNLQSYPHGTLTLRYTFWSIQDVFSRQHKFMCITLGICSCNDVFPSFVKPVCRVACGACLLQLLLMPCCIPVEQTKSLGYQKAPHPQQIRW